MGARVDVAGLRVARELYDFINDEAVPGTGVDPEALWDAFGALVRAFAPRNRALLAQRDALQARIDAWYRDNREKATDLDAYKAFLAEIGYLVPEGPDFAVTTANVDAEIASIPGPQLVVPVMNARYALNAANARWGSLYDALYGTDAISEDGGQSRVNGFNPLLSAWLAPARGATLSRNARAQAITARARTG